MRKVSFLIILSLLLGTYSNFAQVNPSNDLKQLLVFYYSIKNALVADDPGSAAVFAQSFLNVANAMDHHLIYEGDLHALILDAVLISGTRDLKKQRVCFCNLSANMGVVANSTKLTSDLIFKQYCPQKKASWLSSDRIIKNPYHGVCRDNCDEVIEIIQ